MRERTDLDENGRFCTGNGTPNGLDGTVWEQKGSYRERDGSNMIVVHCRICISLSSRSIFFVGGFVIIFKKYHMDFFLK